MIAQNTQTDQLPEPINLDEPSQIDDREEQHKTCGGAEPGAVDDLRPPVPDYWIIDQQRSPEAVQAGRHPGAARTLSAAVLTSKTQGVIVATAFQYRDAGFWRVDIENPALKAAGFRPLDLEVLGFEVRRECQARDWLKFFGSLVFAANRGRAARAIEEANR